MSRRLVLLFVCGFCLLSITGSAIAGGKGSSLKHEVPPNESSHLLMQNSNHSKQVYSPKTTKDRFRFLKDRFNTRSSRAFTACAGSLTGVGIAGFGALLSYGEVGSKNEYSPVDDPDLFAQAEERRARAKKLMHVFLGIGALPAASAVVSCAAAPIFRYKEKRAASQMNG